MKLLVVVCLVVVATVVVGKTDFERLSSFYDQSHGKKWHNNNNWNNESVSVCKWYGVTCDDNDQVHNLVLKSNNLNPSIPNDKDIWNGWGIHKLDLSDNFQDGTFNYVNIPTVIALAPDITHLILAETNQYPFIPTQFGTLSNLVKLDLHGAFRYFDRRDPHLIPTELGNLPKLEYLDVSSNPDVDFTIPSTLGNIKTLQSLDFSDTGVYGSLPEELGNLANLQSFNVLGGSLSGTIPQSYSSLTNVTYMDLTDNNLIGFVTPLEKITGVNTLKLGGNSFYGPVPTLEYLTNLTYLILSDNQFSGTLPETIADKKTLEYVYIEDLGLTGTLPKFKSNKLERFIADNNNFRGTLGNWICFIKYATNKNSQFDCPLPTCCGNVPVGRCGHIPCAVTVEE